MPFPPRPLTFAVLVFSCVFASLGFAADEAALEARFREANQKLNAGEFQPALEIYNAILESEPDATNVWVMRAIAKWRLKDVSGARADLTQAIRLHPEHIDAYRVRGQIRFEAQDFEASLGDFTRAIELTEAAQPGNESENAPTKESLAELYGMRGEVQKQRGERAAAISDLSRAIELKPAFPAALFMRGELYADQDERSGAISDYTKLLELEPKFPNAHAGRGWVQFYDQNWNAALADANQAHELNPKAAPVIRLIGFCQFARGEYEVAAKTLAEAADAEPKTGEAYPLFIRHYALLRAGGADNRLAQAWPGWTDDPWAQAVAKFITGQLSEDELELLAKEPSDDAARYGRLCEMHFYIGLARRAAGDKSTARLRFEAVRETKQPNFIEFALSFAEMHALDDELAALKPDKKK